MKQFGTSYGLNLLGFSQFLVLFQPLLTETVEVRHCCQRRSTGTVSLKH